MTSEAEPLEPHEQRSLRELSWPDRLGRLFNRTALGAGVLALGWLLLNAYWLRTGALAVGLVATLYLQHRLETP